MNPNRDKYPDPTAKKVERELTAEELEVSYLVKIIRQLPPGLAMMWSIALSSEIERVGGVIDDYRRTSV